MVAYGKSELTPAPKAWLLLSGGTPDLQLRERNGPTLRKIGDGIMVTQQQPYANWAVFDALDQLQASLRERGVDLVGWEQAVKAERKGRSNG